MDALSGVGPATRSSGVGRDLGRGEVSVLLVDASDRGGIALYTERLAAALRAVGVGVQVAAPAGLADPGLELDPPAWGPTVDQLSRAGLYRQRLREIPGAFASLRRAVLRAQADLVHVQTEVVPGIDPVALRWVRRHLPVVLTVHDPIPHSGGARYAADQARRWRAVDGLVVHAQQAVRFVEASAPGVPVHVAPVDLPFGTLRIGRGEARERLGLDGGPVALLLGDLRASKGVEIAAAFWPAVTGAVPGARLALVGRPVPSPAFDQLSNLAGVDVHAGWLREEEIDCWAAAADVILLPYYVGSHSNVLHRALWARTPVVASPALAEEVYANRAGSVVPLIPGAWAEAVGRILEAPEAPGDLGPAGTGAGTASATLAVYRSVLGYTTKRVRGGRR